MAVHGTWTPWKHQSFRLCLCSGWGGVVHIITPDEIITKKLKGRKDLTDLTDLNALLWLKRINRSWVTHQMTSLVSVVGPHCLAFSTIERIGLKHPETDSSLIEAWTSTSKWRSPSTPHEKLADTAKAGTVIPQEQVWDWVLSYFPVFSLVPYVCKDGHGSYIVI